MVVLDLTLPERDGMDVLATLREAKSEVPVILITASGETKDGIAGLEAGAVDYLVKPFSVIELAARIRAQLRRVAPRIETSLKREDVELDLLTRTVRRGRAEPFALTETEFALLSHLMRNSGRVISRDELLRVVWRAQPDPANNLVDVYAGLSTPQARRRRGSGADPHRVRGRLPLRQGDGLMIATRAARRSPPSDRLLPRRSRARNRRAPGAVMTAAGIESHTSAPRRDRLARCASPPCARDAAKTVRAGCPVVVVLDSAGRGCSE